MTVDLHLGDCLDLLRHLPDKSVDAVITDPPYGTTECAWDSIVPLAPMWDQLRRILRPLAAVVFFASFPFSGALWASNPDWFKYALVWEKSLVGDVMNAKNKPVKQHEDVLVFSDGTTANRSARRMTYNPQGLSRSNVLMKNRYRLDGQASFKPRRPSHGSHWMQEFTNYPRSILRFPNPQHNSPHPTAKPVALVEYLVRTYSNPGQTVLDFTMGSGTTGVACVRSGRSFIGMEIDPAYFAIAERRIAAAQAQPALLPAEPNAQPEQASFLESDAHQGTRKD